VLERAATTKEIKTPGSSQTVTRFEIDVAAMKTQSYKFDAKGDIVAAPNGERILRAGSIAGMNASRLASGATGAGKADANGGLNAGGANPNTAGAQSSQEGYVREIKIAGETHSVSRLVIDQPPARVKSLSQQCSKPFKNVWWTNLQRPVSSRFLPSSKP
jgi:hypothetical protein